MFKLRQTWTDVLPNKVLYNLDMHIKILDPAWPVTAKQVTGKKIFFNPKFLEKSLDEVSKTYYCLYYHQWQQLNLMFAIALHTEYFNNLHEQKISK